MSSGSNSAVKLTPFPAPLGDRLGEVFATIYVGPEKAKFIVHKNLLCTVAEFFYKALNGSFKEAQENTIHLEEDKPAVISLFVGWVYTSSVADGHTQKYLDTLFDLYFFAERILLFKLVNMTMDKIQDISLRYDLYMDYATLARVWENTKDCSSIRFYGKKLLIHGWKKDWKSRELVMDPDVTDRIAELAEIGQGRPEFLKMILGELYSTVKCMVRDKVSGKHMWDLDPRARGGWKGNEDDAVVACLYHSHYYDDSTCHFAEQADEGDKHFIKE